MADFIWKKDHNLEDLLAECAEMCNFADKIGRLIKNKNRAYLKEKEAEMKKSRIELTNCEMYRYLSAM